MKTIILTLTIILFTGCNLNQKPLNQMMEEIREDFAKEAKINNTKILHWENLIDSLYKLSIINTLETIKTIDILIHTDTSLNKHEISELHFIKGDLYYRIDSLQKSIDEFSTAGYIYDMKTPKDIVARAGAYIKLKQFNKAYLDLTKAASINYDYYWNIGNYYEILGKKDSAIFYYKQLYIKDTIFYKLCNDRALELKHAETKLLTELIFRDRKRSVLLMKGMK